MKKYPALFQKIAVLCHNFIFSNNPEILQKRKNLKFSDLETSTLINEGLNPNLSEISEYSALYSNVNKLSHNLIFRTILSKSKQTADKISNQLKLNDLNSSNSSIKEMESQQYLKV